MERLLISFMLVAQVFGAETEYGSLVGSFEDEATTNNIAGTVYAVDDSRFYIKGFTFDGNSACAAFYAGTTNNPQDDDGSGVVIPLKSGSETLGRPYQTEDLLITLPTRKVKDYKWFSVRCSSSEILAYVFIQSDLTVPSPLNLGPFSGTQHSFEADNIILLNSKQIRFVGLGYDGTAPGAVFWSGPDNPHAETSFEVPHPSIGSPVTRLPLYMDDTVTVTLPGDFTLSDVRFIGIWCEPFDVSFGHKTFTVSSQDEANLPPMVEPPTEAVPGTDLDNCQVMRSEMFHIAWMADMDNNMMTLEFRGLVAANQYMAFGISGSTNETEMVGSDVTVVWIDPNDSTAKAADYYLSRRSQCIPNTGEGACPDDIPAAGGVNDVELISGTTTNGVTVIKVTRPLTTNDTLDTPFDLSGSVYVSWAIGFLNPTGHTAKHDILPSPRRNVTVNFGLTSSQCPALKAPENVPDAPEPWEIEPIVANGNDTFVAMIGPSGGQKGYQGIANQVGWGIAWYINDTLIPELHVRRGNTYRFLIFGGDDESDPSLYHPFYISDKLDGGYIQKEASEQMKETIYAEPVAGPRCEFQGSIGLIPEDYDQFADYKARLTRKCYVDNPQPAVLTWKVDKSTPDLVYYQCYQHRFFGWKIHVTDSAVDLSTISVMSMTLMSCLAMVLARWF